MPVNAAELKAGSRVAFVLGASDSAAAQLVRGIVVSAVKGEVCHVAAPGSVVEDDEEQVLTARSGTRFCVLKVNVKQVVWDKAEELEELRRVAPDGITEVKFGEVYSHELVTAYATALEEQDFSASAGDVETIGLALQRNRAGQPSSPSTSSFVITGSENLPDLSAAVPASTQLEAMMAVLNKIASGQAHLSARVNALEGGDQAEATGAAAGPAASTSKTTLPVAAGAAGAAAQAANLLASSGLWEASGSRPPAPPAEVRAGKQVLKLSEHQAERVYDPVLGKEVTFKEMRAALGEMQQGLSERQMCLRWENLRAKRASSPNPGDHECQLGNFGGTENFSIDTDEEGESDSDGSAMELNAPPLIARFQKKKRARRNAGALAGVNATVTDASTMVQLEIVKMLKKMQRAGNHEDDASSGTDGGFVKSTKGGGIRGLHRQRRRFKRNPGRSLIRYRQRVMRKLGVQVLEHGGTSAPWAYTDHSLRIRPQFGRMTGLWRVHYSLGKILQACENQQLELVAGLVTQLLKALQQTALDGGCWSNAVLLLPWEDPLERDLWAGEEDELETAVKFSRSVKDLNLRLNANVNGGAHAHNGQQEEHDATETQPPAVATRSQRRAAQAAEKKRQAEAAKKEKDV